MNLDDLLIYGGAIVGDPNPKSRANYLRNLGDFLWFFQRNGLTRRTVLRNKRTALLSTKIMRSDLTEEGLQVFRTVFPRWLDAIDPKAFENANVERLEKALARVQKLKGKAKGRTRNGLVEKLRPRRQRVSVTRPKTKSHRNSASFETARTDEEYFENAGPHTYDKAEWHLEGDFPSDLNDDQAFVHAGIYIWWLCEQDMIRGEFLRDAKRVKLKQITGVAAYRNWGGALTSEMLNEVGNRFTRYYYQKKFFADYEKHLVKDLPTFYHVQSTRQNYLKIAPIIDERYQLHLTKKY